MRDIKVRMRAGVVDFITGDPHQAQRKADGQFLIMRQNGPNSLMAAPDAITAMGIVECLDDALEFGARTVTYQNAKKDEQEATQ